MSINNYLPKNGIDLNSLASDLKAKRQEFNQEVLAKLLSITGPALAQKIKGRRAWKKDELIIIASRLGKDYRDYFFQTKDVTPNS